MVVHDDVDLDFGEVKHQFARGAAGHRGVESIIEALGSEEFSRVRIGVGRPSTQMDIDKWVLQNFSENNDDVQKLIERAGEVVINWLKSP